jgi:hypothetical protein
VSQISPPIRIVLVVAVAFLGVYMAFLRPKSESAPAPPPAATPTGNVHNNKPAVTGLGKTVEAAQGAAKATEKQMGKEGSDAGVAPAASESARSGGAASESASTTRGGDGAAATTASGAKVSGLPMPVLKAIAKHKVLVLLFWNKRSADDKLVRQALRHVEHFDGGVFVHAAPIDSIARYGRITRGVDVQQSPTVVVVDRKLRATTLVGFVDADTINQAVVDAAQASGGLFRDAYLTRINNICSGTAHDLYAMPEASTAGQVRTAVRRHNRRFDRFVATFRHVPAPARWRAFKRASLSDLRVISSARHGFVHGLGAHPSLVQLRGLLVTAAGRMKPAVTRFNHRVDRHGLIFCGKNN